MTRLLCIPSPYMFVCLSRGSTLATLLDRLNVLATLGAPIFYFMGAPVVNRRTLGTFLLL